LRKRVIIFDMDGTLLDSSKSITKSINYVRKELGLPPFSVEKVTKLINEPDINLPKLFYEERKPYEECRKIFEKHYYEQCVKDMSIYEGIEDMLKKLSKDGYILSVATNAREKYAKKMLNHQNIDKYFRFILGSDSLNSRKPDPQMIHHILNECKIDKNEAVMIGDSLKDEEAAKNAGVEYIFVTWGFGECKEPDFTLQPENLKDIYKIV